MQEPGAVAILTTMSKVMEQRRCAICGKEIPAKEPIFKIEHKNAAGRKEWGRAHEMCFLKRVGGPQDVLAVIRQRAHDIVHAQEAPSAVSA